MELISTHRGETFRVLRGTEGRWIAELLTSENPKLKGRGLVITDATKTEALAAMRQWIDEQLGPDMGESDVNQAKR